MRTVKNITLVVGIAVLLISCRTESKPDPIRSPEFPEISEETPEASPKQTPSPEEVKFIFDGKGEQVIRFSVPTQGLYIIATNHNGDEDFLIEISDLSDNFIGKGADCKQICDDYKAVTLYHGEYNMKIQADGWWLIRGELIEPHLTPEAGKN